MGTLTLECMGSICSIWCLLMQLLLIHPRAFPISFLFFPGEPPALGPGGTNSGQKIHTGHSAPFSLEVPITAGTSPAMGRLKVWRYSRDPDEHSSPFPHHQRPLLSGTCFSSPGTLSSPGCFLPWVRGSGVPSVSWGEDCPGERYCHPAGNILDHALISDLWSPKESSKHSLALAFSKWKIWYLIWRH
jgi:hypothetical protein